MEVAEWCDPLRLHDNRLRKVAYDVASRADRCALIWSYTSSARVQTTDTFSKAGAVLVAEGSLRRAALGGYHELRARQAGYLWQRWNPDLPGGGDMELVPLGVRDVLPYGATHGKTVQEWQGVIVRQTVDAAALAQQYPTKRTKIESSTGQWFDAPAIRGGGKVGVISPFQMIARSVARSGGPELSSSRRGTVDLMIAFVKDYSANTSDAPTFMGKPDSWGYWVNPGDPLYPRGRMIKFTTDAVLEDGPCSTAETLPHPHRLLPFEDAAGTVSPPRPHPYERAPERSPADDGRWRRAVDAARSSPTRACPRASSRRWTRGLAG